MAKVLKSRAKMCIRVARRPRSRRNFEARPTFLIFGSLIFAGQLFPIVYVLIHRQVPSSSLKLIRIKGEAGVSRDETNGTVLMKTSHVPYFARPAQREIAIFKARLSLESIGSDRLHDEKRTSIEQRDREMREKNEKIVRGERGRWKKRMTRNKSMMKNQIVPVSAAI